MVNVTDSLYYQLAWNAMTYNPYYRVDPIIHIVLESIRIYGYRIGMDGIAHTLPLNVLMCV